MKQATVGETDGNHDPGDNALVGSAALGPTRGENYPTPLAGRGWVLLRESQVREERWKTPYPR